MRCLDCHHGRCVTHWVMESDRVNGVTTRYYVTDGKAPEAEVTKAEWVATERRAGFYNTLGHPEEPATAGFSTTDHGGLEGRIEWSS